MKLRLGPVVIAVGTASLLPLAPPTYAAESVGASNYPARPIRWIIPFPPGGSNDVLGRYLGIKLSERLGQQVVIDNRAGANGIIGTEIAAQSAPDGYTLLMISTSYVMNAAVRPREKPLPYDIEKAFDPIATIGSSPNSIVVHPKSFSSLRDLIDQARAKPGAINYASTGVGGFNHFGGELLKKIAKIDMVHVPYKGGGPAMTDVMGGQIPVMFSSLTQVLPHVRNQRLKVLAVGARERSPVVPDVPTVAEEGFPGYEVYVWWGVSAPAGAPRQVAERLRREFTVILQDPETKKRLLADSAEPMNLSQVEFRKLISEELVRWRGVAQSAGISVQ
jgi:tripartite-type tricarboxylate transporter receptor subunit TctC